MELNYTGNKLDINGDDDEKTVSCWQLDEESVGFISQEPSEVKDNRILAPHAPDPFTNIKVTVPEDISNVYGNPSAPSEFANADFWYIATIAPNAIRDPGLYNGNVGEILTHESWRRHLAGMPPGEPSADEEQKDPAPEEMLASTYNSEVDTDTSNRAQSEDEKDVYGTTPPPIAIDDPNDSDFDVRKAEAATAHDLSLDAFDFDDDAADDDDDFVVRRHKRGPYRKCRQCCKASDTARAGPRKEVETSRGDDLQGSWMTLTSSRQKVSGFRSDDKSQSPCGIYRKHEQLDANIVATSFTTDAASQATMLVRSGSFTDASSQEEIFQKWIEDEAQSLQKTIAKLYSELKLAEAAYDEDATNLHAKDSRKKIRRQAKVAKIQEQLCKAVKDQEHFEKIYTPDNVTMNTGPNTAASYSTGQSAAENTTLLQALRKEVSELKDTIKFLQRKVAHCEGQVHAVEIDSSKFANKRAGFEKGRITRLENARHSLSHHLQLLKHKQKLYNEENKKFYRFDSVKSLDEEQVKQQKPDDEPEIPAAGQSQPSLFQTSSPFKRKAF